MSKVLWDDQSVIRPHLFIDLKNNMYHIRPYTSDFIIEPMPIMYRQSSYHTGKSNRTDDFTESGPILEQSFLEISAQMGSYFSNDEIINKNLLESCYVSNDNNYVKNGHRKEDSISRPFIAIEKLQSLCKRLDEYISKFSPQASPKKCEDSKGVGIRQIQRNNIKGKESAKIDKKEERKEKREAAKMSILNTELKSDNTLSAPILIPFEIIKSPKDSPESAFYSIHPNSNIFPLHRYDYSIQHTRDKGPILCTYRDKDLKWISILYLVSRKIESQVLFSLDIDHSSFALHNNNTSREKTIHVDFIKGNEELRLTCQLEGLDISDELSIWKFLGTILGLYSSQDPLTCVLNDDWLLRANHPQLNVNEFTRELSRKLASSDFLCNTKAICLADLIIRSLFNESEFTHWTQINVNNNVQLWIKRIDDNLFYMADL